MLDSNVEKVLRAQQVVIEMLVDKVGIAGFADEAVKTMRKSINDAAAPMNFDQGGVV